MSEFAVGEVAIYCRQGSAFNGCEVTILEPLEKRKFLDALTGKICRALCYVVDNPGGPESRYGFVAEPHELRKKRPPQDWVRLCKLDELPSDVRSAEVA